MLLSFRFLFKRDVTWLSAKSEAIQSGDLKGSYIKMQVFFFAIFLVGSQGWGWDVSPAHCSALYEHFFIPLWHSESVLAPGHFPESGKF